MLKKYKKDFPESDSEKEEDDKVEKDEESEALGDGAENCTLLHALHA